MKPTLRDRLERVVIAYLQLGQRIACRWSQWKTQGRLICTIPSAVERFVDRLPLGIVLHPFQVCVHVIAIWRGVSYLAQIVPAANIEQVLPEPIQLLVLGMLAFGAALGLVGVVFVKHEVERVGLLFIAPASAVYALANLVQQPARGSLSYVIYFAIFYAVITRLWQMRTATRIVARRHHGDA